MPAPTERGAPAQLEPMASRHAEPVLGAPNQSVFIRIHPWLKQKPHRRVWQWGSINLVNESEPDRRAAQQQRVQQQIQIHIAIHTGKLTVECRGVKYFSGLHPAAGCWNTNIPCASNKNNHRWNFS